MRNQEVQETTDSQSSPSETKTARKRKAKKARQQAARAQLAAQTAEVGAKSATVRSTSTLPKKIALHSYEPHCAKCRPEALVSVLSDVTAFCFTTLFRWSIGRRMCSNGIRDCTACLQAEGEDRKVSDTVEDKGGPAKQGSSAEAQADEQPPEAA